jgi:hypothetical protein
MSRLAKLSLFSSLALVADNGDFGRILINRP